MITRINEKWDPISWGWLSQNTFHTTSTVLVANLIPRRLGKDLKKNFEKIFFTKKIFENFDF